jgi:V-type H+-transporting ATPase proteolipid subunit
MISTVLSVFFTISLVNPINLGYIGIIYCFLLASLGTAQGIWTISNYVSGTSIKHPRVGTKSILGTVVCEANFLSGIILCVLNFNLLKSSPNLSIGSHYILFSSSVFVGLCSYFSSVATGVICAVISLMDGKDDQLFFKVVVLEIIPASVGLIGFILGIVMSSKTSLLMDASK